MNYKAECDSMILLRQVLVRILIAGINYQDVSRSIMFEEKCEFRCHT